MLASDIPAAVERPQQNTRDWVVLAWLGAIAVVLLLAYAPLLFWLGRISWQVGQLTTAGVLVLFLFATCFQRDRRRWRFDPRVRPDGLAWLTAGLLVLYLASRVQRGVLLLVLLSFCLSLAAMISFLVGTHAATRLVPALAAFVVFGMLVALFPTLDWPLRSSAARHAAGLLGSLGVPVELAVALGQAPELLLQVGRRTYVVAAECNGFGLLTSSLLLAVFCAFYYRPPWFNKLGLVMIAIPVAIGCNFLRIAGICLVAPWAPVSYHLVHESLGLVFYYLGLGIIWVLARRVARPPEREASGGSAESPSGTSSPASAS
ncbi:exosortase/archaeosortase family protein [bacterium]|nr:exosortase/archaeosortase family protein [bacterium]